MGKLPALFLCLVLASLAQAAPTEESVTLASGSTVTSHRYIGDQTGAVLLW